MVEGSSTSFNPLESPATGSRAPEEPNTSASTQHKALCRTHPIISRKPKIQHVRLVLWSGEAHAPQPGKWFQVPPLWR